MMHDPRNSESFGINQRLTIGFTHLRGLKRTKTKEEFRLRMSETEQGGKALEWLDADLRSRNLSSRFPRGKATTAMLPPKEGLISKYVLDDKPHVPKIQPEPIKPKSNITRPRDVRPIVRSVGSTVDPAVDGKPTERSLGPPNGSNTASRGMQFFDFHRKNRKGLE